MVSSSSNSLPWSARLASWSEELQPDRLFSSFVAGSITGMIGVIRAISYAALIFSGSLAIHLNVGVGIAVLSSAIISIVVALGSSLPGMIATPLAAPTAVLAILAAQIVQSLDPTKTDTAELLVTVIAAIAIGSIVTGATLFVLGLLRGGNALQFVPYPVVGGFMAATGGLLVRGAIQVMTEEPLMLSNLSYFMNRDPLLHWGSGLVVALALLVATKRLNHPLVMPGVLLIATGAFYAVVWQSHLPLETIRSQGWLLGPFPDGNLWQPLTPAGLGQVHWGIIAQHSNTLGLLVFVSLLSLILTNGGIELALGRDLDLNQELRAVGMANMMAGLGSTMAGNQALPSTLLVHKMGANSRLTGLFKTLPCFAVLLLGPAFLAYFPKPILGSLLLFLGLDLLWKWLYQVWFRLGWQDYLTILVTLVMVNWVGFMAGIGIGFALTALQFLVNCARTRPIGSPFSSVAACFAETPLAQVEGKLDWVDLQGFLFFGNAAFLFQDLRSRLHNPEDGQMPDYLVLNFQAVLGMDASAVLSFNKLLKLAHQQPVTLVFSQVSESLEQQLKQGQAIDDGCMLWESEAEAIAWCEAQGKPATPEPALVIQE